MSSFDPSVPNVPRVYDYLLGGKDNFEVDRMMAAGLVEILPPLPAIPTAPPPRRDPGDQL